MAISIQTTQYNLIYVYSRKEIPDALKVGKASINAPDSMRDLLTPNCDALNEAAINCIKEQTQRAAADFSLLYTELAWFENTKGEGSKFMDTDVHDILIHSGYERKIFNYEVISPHEWFKVDLPTVIKAIAAVKHEQEFIDGPVVVKKPKKEIHFREEQENAISQTIEHFEKGTKMLWNAKMRFGKTLCALELIRRKQYGRVLILTHRPAVRSGWFEDYHNLDFENQQYGSKNGDKFAFCNEEDNIGKDFETLEEDYNNKGVHYIYFASMQDLRGSKAVTDKGINKNDDVFKTDWDLIILDEAHEGTETALGKNVIKELCEGHNPYLLYLSGTPFNILYHFSEDEIYTWDYIMEQDAKENWHKLHADEPNPYEGLARLNIYTYDLGDVFETNMYTRTEDDFFNFAEFFRVWTGNEKADGAVMESPEKKGTFVHEEHVRKFLDMLCDECSDSKYPYSTEYFRNSLNHTLWMLPGVDAASALEKLIKDHRLTKDYKFTIINVAGEGSKIEGVDEDDAEKIEKLGKDALRKVKTVIKLKPRTITLSCGRLTTGVSVPEWTGVFMLRGGFNVDAGNYMQTIFRGQTPFKNGTIKTNCYAFDFAPDRTLTVIDDYIEKQPSKQGSKHGKGEKVASMLRLCPVIAMKGSQEVEYDAMSFINEVNKAYKEHVIRNGFKGRMLHKNFADFTQEDYALLAEIGKLFSGKKVDTTTDGKVKITNSGLTGEDGKKKGTKKPKKKTPSKPKTKTRSQEESDRRKKSQNVLDLIFVRLPLLLFGAVEDASHLTIKELLSDNVIDQPSWDIFMPEKFTKPMFDQISHLIKEDLLISCTAEIIKNARNADTLPVEKRVKDIARMISTFHYPDHETVLTPWNVVNKHLSDTIGGYVFFDNNFSNMISEPRWTEREGVTENVFKENDTQILEINSKSGVYPLYIAYTLWRVRCEKKHAVTETEQQAIWYEVLRNNVFVLCQTEMAKKITERVLRGYRSIETNCKVYPDLVEILRLKDSKENNKKKERLIKKLKSTNYWNVNNGNKDMKFNAVVSNPPYQTGDSKDPLYHLFIDLGRELGDLGTMIHPGRFLFNVGKTPKVWDDKMLNDKHIKVVDYWEKSLDVFDNVSIKGGVAITMWNKAIEYSPIVNFIPNTDLREIASKFTKEESKNLSSIIFAGRSNLKFNDIFLKDFPNTIADRLKFIQLKKPDVKKLGPNEEYELKSSAFEVLPYIFSDNLGDDHSKYYHILGLYKTQRAWRYIKREYMAPRYPENNNIDKYKVFVPKANGSGLLGETLGKSEIGKPGDSSSTTFISIGAFNFLEEAINCSIYLKTKFLRCLLGVLKKTQDNPPAVWAYIPIQDFTSNSDIDWSKSIEDIDKQLYKKYGLSEHEIEFIEINIQKME